MSGQDPDDELRDPTSPDWSSTEDDGDASQAPAPHPEPGEPPPPPASGAEPPPASGAEPPPPPYAAPASPYDDRPSPYGVPVNPYATDPGAGGPAAPGRPEPNPYAVDPRTPASPGAYWAGAPGGPAAWPTSAPARSNAPAVVLLVLSAVLVLLCCLTQIPSLILAIVSLSKKDVDPEGAARMVKYGWIAFGAGLAIALVGIGGLVAMGMFSTADGGYT